MEASDLHRQPPEVFLGDLTLAQKIGHQSVLGQAANLDGVLHRLSGILNGELAALFSYLYYPQVNIRREASVQLYLTVTILSTLLKGSEVQEAVVDGLPYLIDMTVCEQEIGDMGLGHLHGGDLLGIRLGLQKPASWLVGGSWFTQASFQGHDQGGELTVPCGCPILLRPHQQ